MGELKEKEFIKLNDYNKAMFHFELIAMQEIRHYYACNIEKVFDITSDVKHIFYKMCTVSEKEKDKIYEVVNNKELAEHLNRVLYCFYHLLFDDFKYTQFIFPSDAQSRIRAEKDDFDEEDDEE